MLKKENCFECRDTGSCPIHTKPYTPKASFLCPACGTTNVNCPSVCPGTGQPHVGLVLRARGDGEGHDPQRIADVFARDIGDAVRKRTEREQPSSMQGLIASLRCDWLMPDYDRPIGATCSRPIASYKVTCHAEGATAHLRCEDGHETSQYIDPETMQRFASAPQSDEAWQHAACLSIAEGRPGWREFLAGGANFDKPTTSAAMKAVAELRAMYEAKPGSHAQRDAIAESAHAEGRPHEPACCLSCVRQQREENTGDCMKLRADVERLREAADGYQKAWHRDIDDPNPPDTAEALRLLDAERFLLPDGYAPIDKREQESRSECVRRLVEERHEFRRAWHRDLDKSREMLAGSATEHTFIGRVAAMPCVDSSRREPHAAPCPGCPPCEARKLQAGAERQAPRTIIGVDLATLGSRDHSAVAVVSVARDGTATVRSVATVPPKPDHHPRALLSADVTPPRK